MSTSYNITPGNSQTFTEFTDTTAITGFLSWVFRVKDVNENRLVVILGE